MKKLTRFLLTAFSLGFMLTGCTGLSEMFMKDLKTQEIDTPGDVFMIKFNSSGNGIEAADTGYVNSVRKRAAEDLDVDPSSDNARISNAFEMDFPQDIKRSLEISDFNAELFEKFNRSSARAGASSPTIATVEEENEAKSSFYVLYKENKQANRNFTNVASNDKCNVYLDNEYQGNISNTVLSTVASKFKSLCELDQKVFGSQIYPKRYNFFINPKKKIDIVIYDIDGDGAPGKNEARVYGMFYGLDMYTNEALANENSELKSNEDFIIYIDAEILADSNKVKSIYSTLAHEYTHLLNFVNKIKTGYSCPTWYTEMMAMLAEDMLYDVLDSDLISAPIGRLPYFNRNYNYGFLLWDGLTSEQQVEISYPNTYAFGAYLVRNYGGFDLLHEIATNNYIAATSIDKALKKITNDKYTFDDVYYNYPLTFINIYKDGGFAAEYPSFYKEVKGDNDLRFQKISLLFDYKKVDGATQLVELTPAEYNNSKSMNRSCPSIFYADKEKGMVDIGPLSFTLHGVGTDLKKVKYIPGSSDIEYAFFTVQ